MELSSEESIIMSQPCRDNTLYLLRLIDEMLMSEMDQNLPVFILAGIHKILATFVIFCFLVDSFCPHGLWVPYSLLVNSSFVIEFSVLQKTKK